MSFEAEKKAIETTFAATWGNRTPIKYENVEFVEPSNAPWVALTIISVESKHEGVNLTASKIHRGIIVIQIFTVKDRGTNTARELADYAVLALGLTRFSQGSSGQIQTFEPQMQNVGVREGWFQVNLKIEYLRVTSSYV